MDVPCVTFYRVQDCTAENRKKLCWVGVDAQAGLRKLCQQER